MITATIAGHTITLNGCETMQHADRFSLFSPRSADADFRMKVVTVPSLVVPSGVPDGVFGAAKTFRLADGTTELRGHNNGLSLRFTADFADVTLTMCEGLADRERLHYQYVRSSFAYRLCVTDGTLLHSAGMDLFGNGVALCGISGAGKSTLAAALAACEPSARILSEDTPAAVEHGNSWTLHGTPFIGRDTACAAAAVPLRVIVMLQKAPRDHVTVLPPREALHGLLSVMARPSYMPSIAQLSVDRAIRLLQAVPVVRFENSGTAESAAVLLSTLTAHGFLKKENDI